MVCFLQAITFLLAVTAEPGLPVLTKIGKTVLTLIAV
jgi:hypothetical protein